MPTLLAYFLLFTVVGAGFILVNLLVGYLVRPVKPDAEKATIYECGEPTVGTSWIQFDLRFYVVALLFVIFDVEMVFFFPWAVVYGKLNGLSNPALTLEQRAEMTHALTPGSTGLPTITPEQAVEMTRTANGLSWFAFADILFFFAVLIVGFAYLWRRGDLNWVRSLEAEPLPPPTQAATAPVPVAPPVQAPEMAAAH